MTQLINSCNKALPKTAYRLIGVIATCLLISACTPATITGIPATINSQSGSINTSGTTQNLSKLSKQTQILQQAQQIQEYLATDNYKALTPYIHPIKGVRFSMYAYVQKETDKVFSREQFATYLQQSRIKFTWGAKDGSGELYITTLPDFLNSWVAAEQYDFKAATFNKFQGSGNSLNNLKEAYPYADFVEFYHSGKNPEYAGIDWRAMRLVFEEYQGKYYLVVIVNDQWTV